MYRIDMGAARREEDRAKFADDKKEAGKNALVPGARIIRAGAAVSVYENETACREWLYPLSEVNDLGIFSYVEKEKKTDEERPWATRLHPDVNVYYYVLEGEGTLILGGTEGVDEQTRSEENLREAAKNAAILGARVLKREDAPPVYNANAGLRQSSYPLTWTDDIAICNLAEKSAESDRERPFDSHSHPDIEEYKFILSGSGSVTVGVGDETCQEEYYEFRAGDLVILPRGLAHVDAGGYTALYFHTKQSVFGKTPGDSLYPHIAYVYTRPPRPTKEEEAALNDPGTFIKMNSRETYNVYCPNPILRVEKNPTDMTHLRPDLFPERKEETE